MFIQNRNAKLFAVEFGAGPRTFLAHGGWTGSWELWVEPFVYLSKKWRTVAYDHRGTGATVSPVESITIDNMVSDLFAVMDRLEIDKCVLAGESAGGMVVVQAALQQPHRFEGLVLVDAVFHSAGNGDTPFVQGLRTNYPATIAAFVEACVPESEKNSSEVRSWGKKILNRATPESSIRLARLFNGLDLRPNLAGIQIPTLLFHGSHDVIVPVSDSEYAATQIPGGKLVVLEGAGHVPTMTRPREIADEIDNHFP